MLNVTFQTKDHLLIFDKGTFIIINGFKKSLITLNYNKLVLKSLKWSESPGTIAISISIMIGYYYRK